MLACDDKLTVPLPKQTEIKLTRNEDLLKLITLVENEKSHLLRMKGYYSVLTINYNPYSYLNPQDEIRLYRLNGKGILILKNNYGSNILIVCFV